MKSDRRMFRSLFAAAIAGTTLPAFAQNQPPIPPVAPAAPGTPATAPVAPPVPASPRPVPQIPDVAAPKVGRDGMIQPDFERKHEAFLARGKQGNIDLLFLGDSITEGWGGRGKAVWADRYTKFSPANFGIGGDQTQHVLWRIDNGELDGIHPKVLVLMIGTNNIGRPAAEILRADTKIVAEIHQKLPDTKVLVLGIFPRGADPADPRVKGMRDKIKTVNEGLARLDDGGKTRFLDIGDKFLDPMGKITPEIMPDALHPSPAGYTIWADAMQPLLDEMMK